MRGILSLIFFFLYSYCWSQITFYGEPEPINPINSAFGEQFIALDKNENVLYVSREKHPENKAGSRDNGDIWMISLDTGQQVPVQLGINNKDFSAPIGWFNQTHFLFSRTWKDKGSPRGGIFAFTSDKPDEALPIDIPYLRTQAPTLTGSVASNGPYLLLTLENNLGYGVDDLFVSVMDGQGNWGAPRNLGDVINTPYQELTPFLAADNRTLFFASNGHGGFGSFDLFVSTRLDDSWQNWSEPKNLGTQLNTEGAETSFVFNSGATFAYYSSTLNSDGYGDVKRIRIKDEIEEETPKPITMEIPAAVPERFNITFQLLNKKLGQPITGTAVVVESGDSTLLDSNSTGQINVNPTDSELIIEFKSGGFLSTRVTLSSSDFDQINETWLVGLEPLDQGNLITLENVLFYKGTANLIEGSADELDLVFEMLQDNPTVRIFLKGHTDNVGNPIMNIQLSQERVRAVTAYLVQKGIDPGRIAGEGYGGSEPIASNETEETRQLNRRVEFEIRRD